MRFNPDEQRSKTVTGSGGSTSSSSISTSGREDSDIFWYWPGTFIMDAQPNDYLKVFGLTATGGTNSFWGIYSGTNSLAVDWLNWFTYYQYTKEKQLLVYNSLFNLLEIGELDAYGEEGSASGKVYGTQVVQNYDFGSWHSKDFAIPGYGDLGMTFRIYQGGTTSTWAAKALRLDEDFEAEGVVGIRMMFDLLSFISTWARAAVMFAKSIQWKPIEDPLILDLDGDGIETISRADAWVNFDFDGDYFSERTGWLSGDDGFLVLDLNDNGIIDDISEMFGGPNRSGIEHLAEYDSNGDGKISAEDLIWSELKVWRDRDGDAYTDEGELFTLDALGIISINLDSHDLDNHMTPQGNTLLNQGTFEWADGSKGNMYDAAFEADPHNTVYRGEKGRADWISEDAPDVKGYGTMVDLMVGQSSDFHLQEVVAECAANATIPTLKGIMEAITPVFGAWAGTLPTSRELTPVLH